MGVTWSTSGDVVQKRTVACDLYLQELCAGLLQLLVALVFGVVCWKCLQRNAAGKGHLQWGGDGLCYL